MTGMAIWNVKELLVDYSAAAYSTLPVTTALRGSQRIFRFDHTAARRRFSTEHGVNNRRCAAYPRRHFNGLRRAILGAGAALHAGILLIDAGAAVIDAENSMGADDKTHAASHALFLFELQSCHISQVDQLSHSFIP
jgi:hypothetical protein